MKKLVSVGDKLSSFTIQKRVFYDPKLVVDDTGVATVVAAFEIEEASGPYKGNVVFASISTKAGDALSEPIGFPQQPRNTTAAVPYFVEAQRVATVFADDQGSFSTHFCDASVAESSPLMTVGESCMAPEIVQVNAPKKTYKIEQNLPAERRTHMFLGSCRRKQSEIRPSSTSSSRYAVRGPSVGGVGRFFTVDWTAIDADVTCVLVTVCGVENQVQ